MESDVVKRRKPIFREMRRIWWFGVAACCFHKQMQMDAKGGPRVKRITLFVFGHHAL
jgi:hypothetical protein